MDLASKQTPSGLHYRVHYNYRMLSDRTGLKVPNCDNYEVNHCPGGGERKLGS